MDRRGRVGGGVEIVTERCTERGLKPFRRGDLVDDRRPQPEAVERQHLCERAGLGIEPVDLAFGLLQRHAQLINGGARRAAGLLARCQACFRLDDRLNGGFECEDRLIALADRGDLGGDALTLGNDAVALLAQLAEAVGGLA